MKILRLSLLICCLPFALSAQTNTAEEDVKATILGFFDAMRAADSAGLRTYFMEGAKLQRAVYNEEGEAIVSPGDIENFIRSVGSYPAGTLDERLFSMIIQVDEPLATAWTDFTFYAGGKRSHCGVNAFQLIHTADGWKFLNIIDTSRKEDCLEENPIRD